MNGLIKLILKALIALFGQNRMWAAIQEVIATRAKIKIAKFEERAEIRELKNDIEEMKLERKKERKEKKNNKRKSDVEK